MSGASVPEPVPALAESVPDERRVGALFGSFSVPNFAKFGYSLADQIFAVGGMFAVNIALARVRSKEEYGIFTLCYSLFTFLAGLHNAAILEAYTIYGSGRYHGRFTKYEEFIRRNNSWLLAGLSILLVSIWQSLRWLHLGYASPTLLGMALTSGVLLAAAFKRRTFYIQRRPDLAVRFSTAFFVSCLILLGLAIWADQLNGFSAFLIVAAAWSLAFLFIAPQGREESVPVRRPSFLLEEPEYWSEHWKYSRWVFVTALVFQLTTQAYFWVVAAFLSVKDVAGLRAIYNLVLPVDQIFAAITLLVLPRMAFHFAADEMGKVRSMWRRCALFFFGISSVFAVMVGSANTQLLHVFYGPKFDDVAPLLRLYVIVSVVMGVGNAANAALKAIEKPRAVFFAYLASGVATFLLGIPLVVRLGLRGAVYGMLLSAATYTAFLTCSFRRLSRPEIASLTAH